MKTSSFITEEGADNLDWKAEKKYTPEKLSETVVI